MKKRFTRDELWKAEANVKLTYGDIHHLRTRLEDGAQRSEDRKVYLKLIAAEERLEAKYPIIGG